MEILSVTLKNFKSHSDAHFEFQPGTNAICGENGAGKTSILEAIAWGLFNYRGPYRVEDLVRNGMSNAQVRVTFISSLDGRTYEVQRCTQKGYQIYDPQLKARLELNRIEEDVMPWLRQHLGVPSGTDLARLFANTIGVPQGTFTADFLKPAKDRKETFDATLKVEAYRQVFEKLSPLEKYAKSEVEKLEQAIAQYDDSLSDWEPLHTKHLSLSQEITQIETALQQCQEQLSQLKHEKDQLSAQAGQIQQLTGQLDGLTAQIQSQTQISDRLQQEHQRAEQARVICLANQVGYQQFLQAETTLQELEQSRRQQQALLEQRQTYREGSNAQQAQLVALNHQLERFATIQTELEQLEPLVEQQNQLEQQQQALAQEIQACQSWQQTAQVQAKRLQKVQARLAKLTQDITAIAALEDAVQQIPELEQQQQRYQQQLSRIEAAAQFETELRQIVVQGQAQRDQIPVHQAEVTVKELQRTLPLFADSLQTVLTALQASTDLNQQLLSNFYVILSDSEQSPHKIQQQLQQLHQQLQIARQKQAQFLALKPLTAEQSHLQEEANELQASLTHLRTQLTAQPVLQQQQTQLSTALAALNNPGSLRHLYQQELHGHQQVTAQRQALEQSLQTAKDAIADLETQLLTFTDLSDQVQAQQQLRESNRAAYQTYLEHQQLANRFHTCQVDKAAAIAQLQTLEMQQVAVTRALDELSQAYDPQYFEIVQSTYKEAEIQQIKLGARLPEIIKRLQDVESQLENLQVIQSKRDRAQVELQQREKAKHFITFARKAYKQAGPRITERYVHSISREADRLFRELLNRQDVALAWTQEYEIMVQEGAHWRRFISLSGGEQMCAALAVRLALLKTLADIDIAFFDEPTTNMDRPRREQLAEAIANIKTFRQLFVISHDDTFEKVTENIVLVERSAD
jgi:exonuclease SbcC